MPKIHEWKMVSVYRDDGMQENLQIYEREGWVVFQFLGNVMLGEQPIGFNVILKRVITGA
jgi:hypothetical protein